MSTAIDSKRFQERRSLFGFPSGRMYDLLRASQVPAPSSSPLAESAIWFRVDGVPVKSIISIWAPEVETDGWRTVVRVSKHFESIRFDAADPLTSLVDAGHFIRRLLDYSVDPPESALRERGAEDGRENVSSSVDLEKYGKGTDSSDWRAPASVEVRPVAAGFGGVEHSVSIVIGQPRPNPNDRGTHFCPVVVDGLQTPCYGTDSVFALANACSMVENRTGFVYR